MANDQPDDDDEWSNQTQFRKGRVGAWNTQYVRKFTNLLQENTVLLQTAQKYPKNDPIHELRAKAMSHMQKELGMTDLEQVKQKLVTFRKFAANKLKQCAEKCGPNARPETILKTAPAWLRALEPHLSLWTQIRNAKSTIEKAQIEKALVDKKPQPELESAAAPDWAASASARLACVLVQKARELRSLDADAVCKLDCVPSEKAQEVKYVWWRMLQVVTQKLNFQRDGSDAIPAAKLSPVELLLADLLLLLEPTISTLPESNDYDSVQHLVTLFHLAQLHKLENTSPGLSARWQRAHVAYLTRTPQISGLCCGIIMMQRRWHELKSSARRAMVQYSRRQAPPSPLHAAIVKRFPHVVTEPLPTWQELVECGQVIEHEQQGTSPAPSEADADELEAELEGVSLLSPEDLQMLKPYQRSAKEEEDDLVLIEREIETIDLINVGDERDSELEQRAAEKKTVVDALTSELDRQLKDIEKYAGASEMQLFSTPIGEPTLIYESDSDDVECTEDRNKNIDSIARQIILEDITPTVKLEPVDSDDLVVADDALCENAKSDDALCVNPEADDTLCVNGEADDNDCIEIDRKLLMDTRICLLRVDSIPEWKKVSKRPWVDLGLLNLDRFAAKKPRLETLCLSQCIEEDSTTTSIDPNVSVKVEKIKEECIDDSSQPKGERQVKSMAKRLISEIMRAETDEQTSEKNKVPKKVQLPNIEEVRKNNLSMLTAQVAPLGKGAPLPGKGAPLPAGGASPPTVEEPLPERRMSTDSDGELQIDESNIEQVPEDVTLSPKELDDVLEKLASERLSANLSKPMGVSAHSAYCCTARRQRALNAARRRLAARSGRVAPPNLEIHSTSSCAVKNKCTCCCRHLLEQDERGARLEREALEVDVALRRLLGEDASDRGTSNATKKHNNKKKKKPQESDVDQTLSEQSDPLKEWIRQKSLNQKYFNLNLNRPEKPKSETQNEVVKVAPKPDNAEIFTNMAKKVVYRSNPHVLPSQKDGKVFYTIINSPISSLSPSNSESPNTSQSPNINQSDSIPTVIPKGSTPQKKKEVFLSSSTSNKPKNLTFTTRLVEGNNSPKKVVKLSLPTITQSKVISLNNKNGESIPNKPPTLVIQRLSPTVKTPIGKIITTSDRKKTLMLSPENTKLKLGTPSLKNVGNITSPNAISPQLSTSKGSIVIDSSKKGMQEKTANKITPYDLLQIKRANLSLNNAGNVTSSNKSNAPQLSISRGTIIIDSSKKEKTAYTILGKKKTNDMLQGKLVSNTSGLKVGIPASSGKFPKYPKIVSIEGRKPDRVVPTLKPGMATITSVPGVISTSQIAVNRGKVLDINSPVTISKIVRKTGRNNLASYKSPVKIAPKLDKSKDAEQNEDVTGNLEPGLISQDSGTGLKISKISSLAQPAKSESLLRSKNNSGTSVKSTPSSKPDIEFKLETHFKRKDYMMPLDNFLLNKDPTNLNVLVFDDDSDYMTFRSVDGEQHLLLTEADLMFTKPSYWSHVQAKFSARITFDETVKEKSEKKLQSSNNVIEAPVKVFLEKQVYMKLRNNPLIYAKALCAIRTPAECKNLLERNFTVHMLNTRGTLTSVERNSEPGADKDALKSTNVLASLALSEILREVPDNQPPAADVNVKSEANVKSDVNARAEIVMMLNNVTRRTIDMVYVESDDEEVVEIKKDFKGLEHFEEMDDFDL